jgi:hypothetical protein
MFSIFTVTIILPINMVSNANKLFKWHFFFMFNTHDISFRNISISSKASIYHKIQNRDRSAKFHIKIYYLLFWFHLGKLYIPFAVK